MTIRNLDDATKARLRVRAAGHGKSMEDEARDILRAALSADPGSPTNLADAIHRLFAPLGGLDLDIPPRDPTTRPPVMFEE